MVLEGCSGFGLAAIRPELIFAIERGKVFAAMNFLFLSLICQPFALTY